MAIELMSLGKFQTQNPTTMSIAMKIVQQASMKVRATIKKKKKKAKEKKKENQRRRSLESNDNDVERSKTKINRIEFD